MNTPAKTTIEESKMDPSKTLSPSTSSPKKQSIQSSIQSPKVSSRSRTSKQSSSSSSFYPDPSFSQAMLNQFALQIYAQNLQSLYVSYAMYPDYPQKPLSMQFYTYSPSNVSFAQNPADLSQLYDMQALAADGMLQSQYYYMMESNWLAEQAKIRAISGIPECLPENPRNMKSLIEYLKLLASFTDKGRITVAELLAEFYPFAKEEKLQEICKATGKTPQQVQEEWDKYSSKGNDIHKKYQQKYYNENNKKNQCIETEFGVVYKFHEISGRVDIVSFESDKDSKHLRIIEIKTGESLKHFLEEYLERAFLQLHLYQMMLEWMLQKIKAKNYSFSMEIHWINRLEGSIDNPVVIKPNTKNPNNLKEHTIRTITVQHNVKKNMAIIKKRSEDSAY